MSNFENAKKRKPSENNFYWVFFLYIKFLNLEMWYLNFFANF